MDFRSIFVHLTTSVIFFIRQTVLLIFFPYRTMRRISGHSGKGDVIPIFVLAFVYFVCIRVVRQPVLNGVVSFFVFLLIFFLTACFFYVVSSAFKTKLALTPFIYTLSYTLIPTLFWFYTNAILYKILPPPRTLSVWGQGFSIVFIAYSMSLFLWKLILVYLALRFSSRLMIYRIGYMLILYLLLFIPLSLVLYHISLFRIPFL